MGGSEGRASGGARRAATGARPGASGARQALVAEPPEPQTPAALPQTQQAQGPEPQAPVARPQALAAEPLEPPFGNSQAAWMSRHPNAPAKAWVGCSKQTTGWSVTTADVAICLAGEFVRDPLPFAVGKSLYTNVVYQNVTIVITLSSSSNYHRHRVDYEGSTRAP